MTIHKRTTQKKSDDPFPPGLLRLAGIVFFAFLIALLLQARGNAGEIFVTHPYEAAADAVFIEVPAAVDTLPTRQVVIEYDYDRDGVMERVEFHALQEFLPVGPACADYDPQYLLIPRDGYYRIRREADVIKYGNVLTLGVNSGRAE